MKKDYEYYEKITNTLRFLLACKFNNFIHPRSKVEELNLLKKADEWLKKHPGEHINLY